MNIREFFFLPVNASVHGHEVDFIIYIVHGLMFVLFVGWGGFFLFTLFKFRRKKNPKADYHGVKSHVSTSLEIGVAVIEALLLIGFSIPFWAKQVNALPNRTDMVNVRVVAQQFAWNIHYPGEDGVFGTTKPEFVDETSNPVGLDLEDPSAADDIVTINQLHLPIGRPAYIQLSSKDVIHSFFLPVMRVKQDVVPGMSIPVWFIPTKSGKFEIACAQLCGLGHYRMKGYMTIHSEEDFNTWLSEQETSGGGGDEGFDDFWN